MGFFSAIAGIFGGSEDSTIATIAKEWITTDMESAEAKAVMVKAIDPNGVMRKEISRKVFFLYTTYMLTMLLLLILEYFGVNLSTPEDVARVAVVTEKLVELFVPITTMVGVIVGASFGVNYANVKKGN